MPRLLLYPNPASGRVFAEGLEAGGAITVISSEGKTAISTYAGEAGKAELNIERLAPGLYYLRQGKNHLTLVRE